MGLQLPRPHGHGESATRRLGAPASSRQTDGRQTPPISLPTRAGRMAPSRGYSGLLQYIGAMGGLGSLRVVRQPECGRKTWGSNLSKSDRRLGSIASERTWEEIEGRALVYWTASDRPSVRRSMRIKSRGIVV